jgi:hypothetical protein
MCTWRPRRKWQSCPRASVAVAAGNAKRLRVTGRARVGVGTGHAIEISGKDQWLRRIGKRSARAFGKRPLTSFLIPPDRGEDFAAVLDEFRQGDLVFFSILQVGWQTPLPGQSASYSIAQCKSPRRGTMPECGSWFSYKGHPSKYQKSLSGAFSRQPKRLSCGISYLSALPFD